MKILFVESEPSRLRDYVADRDDTTMVFAEDLNAGCKASKEAGSCLALVSWECFTATELDRDEALKTLHHGAQSVICVIPPETDDAIKQAFDAGFNDFIPTDACRELFLAKVAQAEQLEQLNQRLSQAQKLESIGELAAGIAHEINTPIQYVGDNTRFVLTAYDDLNKVLTCCQNLIGAIESKTDIENGTEQLKEAMDEADVEYLLEEIPAAINQSLEGVDRVANIVRAMKEFAHPGASEMTATDLSKAIENTVMVARNEWKYVAEVDTIFDAELPAVPCLPGELNQVMLNMIVNAAHAIGDRLGDNSQEKGTLTIETRKSGPFAEIRISDSGCGISQENIEKIFTPFFTTKAAGKGTGQGLAIAHSVIVEKHNGVIDVESEIGVGTTFIIQIPLEQQRVATEV